LKPNSLATYDCWSGVAQSIRAIPWWLADQCRWRSGSWASISTISEQQMW